MTTAVTPTDDAAMQYGYGMFIVDLGGTPLWTHPGENGGYSADVTMLPTRRFATALLINTDSGYQPAAYYGAAQTFTGVLPPPPDDSFNNADVAEHAGTYQSNTAGSILVAQTGSTVQITVGGSTSAMTPAWKDAYTFTYAPWGGAPIEVSFGRVNGQVKYVVARPFVGARQ
jgi:hypothetical protein